MCAANKTPPAKHSARKPSPEAKGIFVSLSPELLKQLDADRATLNLSRGGAMRAIFEHYGAESLDAVQARILADEADAESVQPLVDAFLPLVEAWTQRAIQRQSIGVHTNQIAKLTNVLSLMVRDGVAVPADDVERIAAACEEMAHQIATQAAAELEDETLIAEARVLIKSRRDGS